jgi:hypothetical protein
MIVLTFSDLSSPIHETNSECRELKVKELFLITELKFCDGVPWKIDKACFPIADFRSYKYCSLICRKFTVQLCRP